MHFFSFQRNVRRLILNVRARLFDFRYAFDNSESLNLNAVELPGSSCLIIEVEREVYMSHSGSFDTRVTLLKNTTVLAITVI